MRSTAWLSGFLTRWLVHPYWLVPVTSTCVVSRNSEHNTWFPSKQRTEGCEEPYCGIEHTPQPLKIKTQEWHFMKFIINSNAFMQCKVKGNCLPN